MEFESPALEECERCFISASLNSLMALSLAYTKSSPLSPIQDREESCPMLNIASVNMPPKRARSLPVDRDAIGLGYSATNQRRWLRCKTRWANLPRAKWKARGILGAGGHGIFGHWRRHPKVIAPAGQPSDVVVKQASPANMGQLEA